MTFKMCVNKKKWSNVILLGNLNTKNYLSSQTLPYTHTSLLCAFHFVVLFIVASNLVYCKSVLTKAFGDL